MDRKRLPLALRAVGPDEVIVRASNDRQPDWYRTRITAEALVEWVSGFLKHRAVNLEHDQSTLAGYAVEVDLAPDLLVRVRLVSEEARAALASGDITGASLEFAPLDWYEEQDGTIVYTRLSSEPELTGLALVSRPAVPGAQVLATRAAPPLWAYAVVDPIVWQRALPPEEATRYAWFPHHRPDRLVDVQALDRAYKALRAGQVDIPEGATLSRDEVIARAWEHLERHTKHGVLMRQVARRGVVPDDPERYELAEDRSWEAPTLGDFTDKPWDELSRDEKVRIARHYAWAPQMPPERFSDLKLPHHDPRDGAVVWRGVVAAMAALMGARGGVDIPEGDWDRVYTHLARHYREFGREPPERNRRVSMEQDKKANEVVQDAAPRKGQADSVEVIRRMVEDSLRSATEAQAASAEPAKGAAPQAAPQVDVRAIVQEEVQRLLARQAPLGTGPLHVRMPVSREDGFRELLYRAMAPLVRGTPATSEELQVVDNIRRSLGLSERSINLTGNTAIVTHEIAREILRKPTLQAIMRNHYPPKPVGGTRITDLGVFQGNISVMFNRAADAPMTDSTATHTASTLILYPLEASAEIANEFERFNILGPSWVDEVFLPEVRLALQAKEDELFFQGSAPLDGLLPVAGATDVSIAAASNPTNIAILRAAVRNLPSRYKGVPSLLRIYARSDIINGALDEIANRSTQLGDVALAQALGALAQGPAPALYISGVPVYYSAALDAAPGKVKAVLVHQQAPYVGESLTLEMRSFPVAGFKTRLELQEWIGWVFPFAEAIVRVSVA